jgi:hypothetical protein
MLTDNNNELKKHRKHVYIFTPIFLNNLTLMKTIIEYSDKTN